MYAKVSLFSNFKDFNAKTDEFHVDQLKHLVDVIYQNATSKQLNLLFGEENIKFKGELKGKTNKRKSFRTTFMATLPTTHYPNVIF